MISAFSLTMGLFPSVNGLMAQEISIDGQVWSTKNLDVTTFRNGDVIPEAKTNEDWIKAAEEGKPAWCYYDNDITTGKKYGKLYNFYAVIDERGLAPAGWHVPTYDEWVTLNKFLGGASGGASARLKSSSGWSSNGNGSNSSGFNALPAGKRYQDGSFSELGGMTCFWTSTKDDSGPWFHLIGDESSSYNDFAPEAYGHSVRCIKD